MSEIPVLVLDASVAAKWYLLDEDMQEKALALHSAFVQAHLSIVMPDFARYEVANTIYVAWKRGRIPEDKARRAIADFLAWDFSYVGTNELVQAAMSTSMQFGCALYDALYLALAESLGADLITADRLLLLKAQPAAPWVKWLGRRPRHFDPCPVGELIHCRDRPWGS